MPFSVSGDRPGHFDIRLVLGQICVNLDCPKSALWAAAAEGTQRILKKEIGKGKPAWKQCKNQAYSSYWTMSNIDLLLQNDFILSEFICVTLQIYVSISN